MKNLVILMTRRVAHSIIRSYVRSSVTIETGDAKPVIPTFRVAAQWPDRIAITDEYGHYSYRNLFNFSRELAGQLTDVLDGRTQERVAFLCPNNAAYVLAQWACWMSGQIGKFTFNIRLRCLFKCKIIRQFSLISCTVVSFAPSRNAGIFYH